MKAIKDEVGQVLNSISQDELSKNTKLKKSIMRIKKLLLFLK